MIIHSMNRHSCQLCKHEYLGRCKLYGQDVSDNNVPCSDYLFGGTAERFAEISQSVSSKVNQLIADNMPIDTDNISDGYHTFGQLYYQRMVLFATLVNLFPELSWKTCKHEDGEPCFGGGWFLVTIDTPEGSYGYHYESKYWDMFHCKELDTAKHWDGYTEEDVGRLLSLLK